MSLKRYNFLTENIVPSLIILRRKLPIGFFKNEVRPILFWGWVLIAHAEKSITEEKILEDYEAAQIQWDLWVEQWKLFTVLFNGSS